MATLTGCIAKAGELLSPEDKKALLAHARMGRVAGNTALDAARQAIERHAQTVSEALAAAENNFKAISARGPAPQVTRPQGINRLPDQDSPTLEQQKLAPTTTEPGALTPMDVVRLKTMTEEFPDMQVTLPGHTESMRLDDAMQAAQKESDLIRTDAELVRVAAECALTNGAA